MQFVSLCQRLSKKLNFIKICQVEVGQYKDLVCYSKKQSFRQCAWGFRQLVLKAGFRPKGGLWVCRKSQKISTASDQYFSYVKNYRGGQIDPPPAGIELIPSKFGKNKELLLEILKALETIQKLILTDLTTQIQSLLQKIL